jgi:hypothetical protein
LPEEAHGDPGDGGGYILAPSHNLQKDIPLANILAMYNVGLRS